MTRIDGVSLPDRRVRRVRRAPGSLALAAALAAAGLAGAAGGCGRDVELEGRSAGSWISDLSANDPMTRRSAVYALVNGMDKLPPERLIKVLLPATGDSDAGVRSAAVMALTKLGDKAVPAATEALKDERRPVRVGAALVLTTLKPGTVAAVPALLEYYADERGSGVKGGPAKAIAEMKEDAIPAFIDGLGHQDTSIRRAAAGRLGEYGPAASAALPKLEALAKDRADEVLQYISQTAINRIKGKPAPPVRAGGGGKP
jgi:HEAT repeat protein